MLVVFGKYLDHGLDPSVQRALCLMRKQSSGNNGSNSVVALDQVSLGFLIVAQTRVKRFQAYSREWPLSQDKPPS